MASKPDPSPATIAERAARIRATWSEVEHRRRAGLPRKWRPLEVATIKTDAFLRRALEEIE